MKKILDSNIYQIIDLQTFMIMKTPSPICRVIFQIKKIEIYKLNNNEEKFRFIISIKY